MPDPLLALYKAESLQPNPSPGVRMFGESWGPLAQRLADIIIGRSYDAPPPSGDEKLMFGTQMLQAILPIASPYRLAGLRSAKINQLRAGLIEDSAPSDILDAFSRVARTHPRTLAAGVSNVAPMSTENMAQYGRMIGSYRAMGLMSPAGEIKALMPGEIEIDPLLQGVSARETMTHELTHAGQSLRTGDRMRRVPDPDALFRSRESSSVGFADERTAFQTGFAQPLIDTVRRVQGGKISAEQRRIIQQMGQTFGKLGQKRYQQAEAGRVAARTRSGRLSEHMTALQDITDQDLSDANMTPAEITEYLREVQKVLVPDVRNRALIRADHPAPNPQSAWEALLAKIGRQPE